MPEVRDFQSVVELAEQAAGAGDFFRAEALLREAAALQEASLGPLHPDLARTFNNLAVACERADKPTDAERFYRRAFDIATAALAPDDPLVATSRDNLRDFCQSRGLVFEDWPGISDQLTPAVADAPAPPTSPAAPAPVPSGPPPAAAPVVAAAARVAAGAASASAAPAPRRPSPPPVAAVEPARAFGGAVAAVAILATLALGYMVLKPAADEAAPVATAADSAPVTADAPPAASPAGAPATGSPNGPGSTPTASVPSAAASSAPTPSAPVSSAPAPGSTTPAATAPTVPPATASSGSAPSAPPPSSPAAAAPADVRVLTATVCESLATGAGAWRCAAVETDGAPGRFAYFTRIASPRPVRVRHRWYQGDRLRQDVVLSVGANASAGYRTFSRQTVSPGDWRVELRADSGALLGESRFVVRAR